MYETLKHGQTITTKSEKETKEVAANQDQLRCWSYELIPKRVQTQKLKLALEIHNAVAWQLEN